MSEASTSTPSSLLDRTYGRLTRMLRDAAGEARVRLTGQVRPELPPDDAERLRRQIDACLNARGGEVSARTAAAGLATTYLSLAATGRARFLQMLAEDYGVDRTALAQAVEAWRAAGELPAKRKAEAQLRRALTPARVTLLTHFNAVPQGVKFLVDLRADLADLLKSQPGLATLDDDLRNLLTGWFDIGFLDLVRISWDSPAALLEKLIAYEAVHRIESWSDLKNRLDSDRRCYAFFHPRMPHEPLIFVEVALVNGMAANVQALLDEHAPAADPKQADTAIFYSISNCQKGLNGVSFGNFLIKRVVDALNRDFPKLSTFATLSPIPGFAAWFARLKDEPLAEAERKALAPHGIAELAGLKAALATPDWYTKPDLASAIEAPLTRLCARYLVNEKQGGRALDRVAHFHLSNGARVERLNWLGDTSAAGLKQSFGLMVNYRYKLDEIDASHEAYATQGTVSAVGAVKKLVK
jgi:malonyl-CoA decarboxylase